jgi:hypothetical protein
LLRRPECFREVVYEHEQLSPVSYQLAAGFSD